VINVFFARVGIMIIKDFVFVELIFLRVASAVYPDERPNNDLCRFFSLSEGNACF